MDLALKGKKCLISGGSAGIGLAIKKALEAEGVEVISWSRREGVDLTKEIPPFPELVDILINNVGGMGTSDDWVVTTNKNYFVMCRMIGYYLSQNQDREYGRVITISSIFGKESGHNPIFDAAKSAQIAFMKSYAHNQKNRNITFNTICPGHIDVGKPFPDNPSIIGKPEDVAGIVTFLCSDIAKHINGACITVDGGASHSF